MREQFELSIRENTNWPHIVYQGTMASSMEGQKGLI